MSFFFYYIYQLKVLLVFSGFIETVAFCKNMFERWRSTTRDPNTGPNVHMYPFTNRSVTSATLDGGDLEHTNGLFK